MKIRYKYEEGRHIDIRKIKCPVCKGKINWIKSIESYEFGHQITLLAECYTYNKDESPNHLFLIRLQGGLPTITIENLKAERDGK